MKLPALIAALLIPCASLAQSRVTIPVQDPVYRDIDRLIALRLVEVGLYGQRPYSRREIARITTEAQASIATREVSRSTRRIVERLAAHFRADSTQRWAIGMQDEFVLMSANQTRGIPTDAVGSVSARIRPLTDGRAGREYREDPNFNVGIEGRLEHRGHRLGLVLQPRLLSTKDQHIGSIEAASALLPIRNVTIEAGRQPIVWGQGMEGGLLFSSSGKP